MPAHSRIVEWKEVAGFFLASYLSRGRLGDLQAEADALRELGKDKLTELLERDVHKGSNARKVLLAEDAWQWTNQKLRLGELRLGPGAPSRDYKRVVKENLKTKNPTVEDFAHWMDNQCLSLLLQKDTTITSFIPTGTVPAFYRRVLVGKQDPNKKTVSNRILDGYHRAVVLYLLGHREVDSYFAVKCPC